MRAIFNITVTLHYKRTTQVLYLIQNGICDIYVFNSMDNIIQNEQVLINNYKHAKYIIIIFPGTNLFLLKKNI